MKLIKKIFVLLTYIFQFTLWHLPVSIMAIIGLYFTFKILANPLVDTVLIINYSFAIVAALSSLSFSYEKAIKGEQQQKDRINYCGERFLHSAILFLIASVIKYFIMQKDILLMSKSSASMNLLFLIIMIFPGVLFLGSLINSIAALRELNSILFAQKKTMKEIGKFI